MHFGHLAQERETIGSINAISFSLFSAPMQTTVDEGRPTYVKYVFCVFKSDNCRRLCISHAILQLIGDRYASMLAMRIKKFRKIHNNEKWVVYIFHDDTVNVHWLKTIFALPEKCTSPEVVLIPMGPNDNFSGLFWRYNIHDHPEVRRYMIWDADSYPTKTSTNILNDWLEDQILEPIIAARVYWTLSDGKTMPKLPGGYIGMDKTRVPSFSMHDLMQNYAGSKTKCFDDAIFLSKIVFPVIKDVPIHRTTVQLAPDGRFDMGLELAKTWKDDNSGYNSDTVRQQT